MPAKRVILTRQARADLRAIATSIRLGSGPRTAEGWARRLRERIAHLAEHPMQGMQSDDLAGRRRLVITPYVVVYRFTDGRQIIVSRILHGARDLPALFLGPDSE